MSGPLSSPSLRCALVACVLSAACESAPPGASQRDLGVGRFDLGGGTDSGGSVVSPRPDGGPILPRSDETYVLPYQGDEALHPLTISAAPGRLDVHFSVDTTGSFDGEIDAMQAALETRIIPAVRDRIPDSQFGVSRFEDFPADPFGRPSDSPFSLLTEITADIGAVRAGVSALDNPLGNGVDPPEAGFEALYQIATGEGYPGVISAFGGTAGEGGVGFREGALHAILHITDAPSHVPTDYGSAFPDTRSQADAIAALQALPATVIGLTGSAAARTDMTPIALATGATAPPEGGVCRTGVDGAPNVPIGELCPLVFDIRGDGSGVSTTIVDALVRLVNTLSYEVVQGGAGEDRFGFIQSIEATGATPAAGGTLPTVHDEIPLPPDGIDDTFRDVPAGTTLDWVVHLRNLALPEQDYEQSFLVSVRVVGDGVVLAEDTLRIVVPAAVPTPPTPDAGPFDAGVAADAGVDAG